MTHRYSFFSQPDGSTTATDLVAAANGTLQGAAAITGGQLVLNGSSGTYLNLPSGVINSTYPAVTIETWASFGTLPVNCFFYGFGNTDGSGAGENYIFCAPQAGRVAITGADPGYTGEQNANSGVNWSGQTDLHIVAIYNPPQHQVVLYTNGTLAAINTNATTPISAVNDVYSYIGRSLYTSDPYAPMSIAEFRVWSGALSTQQVALDAASGPAQIITSPGALQSVGLQVTNQMFAGATQQAVVLGSFASITNVNLFTYGQPTIVSDNTNVITVSATGLVTAVAPYGQANLIATYGGLSATQNVSVTGFVTNRFIFDSFGDGFWTILNQGNSNALMASVIGASQEPYINGATEQQFEVLLNLQNGSFHLRQHSSWLCLGASNNVVKTGGAAALSIFYTGISAQQWYLLDAGGGYYRIFNAASNLVLQTDNGSPANITFAPVSSSPFQLWQFSYQTHYSKKGTGGWVGQYGTGWAYDWGYNSFSPSSLPAQEVYEPMQWGNWNVDASTYSAWHGSSKPIYLLGFNEPDNSTQANMTTGQAISLWPQLQAMNVPLVSPAMQNTFDSWAYDFFNQISSNNYRVDDTAVHWYANPNASSLISTLQSVYNTWGRPVWLTEFSPVDWAGTANWSEQDNFNFLAEFLWMAEDQDWLKRYAIFLFSGTPSTNPWDQNGHRGDFFDSTTGNLTPYGALYASWDADRSLHARTPYFIHNLGTSFRLTSTNSSGPVSSCIRVMDATTQWALLPAPTTNHWYIISLNDGRRLNDSLGTLVLSPVGTVGRPLEWIFSGPDSLGYYFITNAFWSHALNGSGAPPAIIFGTVSSTTQNNNTRWRAIKPYAPVTIFAAATPATLSAIASNQSVALSWSTNTDSFFNIYRGAASGGPYTRIASLQTNTAFVDGNVTNGVPYFYVVTGLNILGEESDYSSEVIARPASTNPTQLNFSVSSNVIQFNWPQDHTGWDLQMQTNPPGAGLGTNWFTVSNSSSTNMLSIPFDRTSGSVFFRQRYP